MSDSNQENKQDFASQAEESSRGTVGELIDFMRDNKKWWMTPILVVVLIFMVLLVLAGSGAAPLLYALF